MNEKEAGPFRRLLAAPMLPGTVVAGKMLASTEVVFLHMPVLLGICAALLQMPLGRSPFLGLVVLPLALALAATGLGMLLGAVAQTPNRTLRPVRNRESIAQMRSSVGLAPHRPSQWQLFRHPPSCPLAARAC